MRISDRITALCQAVAQGESVADIGTDHAYVPLLLYRDGISPLVIMSDISEGSLAKARASFAEAGIDVPDSWFRVGDGIETIAPGEVDDVVIGGLGGLTIIDILSASPELTGSFKKLILQPRNNSGALRVFLWSQGFDILSETLTEEGKFVCEIIVAEKCAASGRPLPYPEDDIRWKFPRGFLQCDPKLVEHRISWKCSSLNGEITNLRKSKQDRSERIAKLEGELAYLQGLLDELV